MIATLSQSGFHWLLRFTWADSDRVLPFQTAQDAKAWAEHWGFKVKQA
jgi:hypothetical protein